MSNNTDANDLPLSGITVIDCGQVVAGPTIAMILGDFGAEVIKVENPAGGDQGRYFGRSKNGVPLTWKQLSRNKKTITLSLSKPAGQELFCRLIEKTQADILVESFRAATFERWNLGYERLRELSPGLTMIRVSGFGQTGPYKDRPGFGTLAEAMSGYAHVTGQPDGPPTLPSFALADTTAALYATIGALLCLYRRDAKKSGRGQSIDVSLLESLYTMLSGHAVAYDQLGLPGKRTGSRTSGSAPRNTYRTKDDRWIAIAGSTQALTERLFKEMGRPELITDSRFRTNRDRLANVEALDEIVGAWVLERTQSECIEQLIRAEVAVAPVADFKDLAEDPHLIARKALATIEDPELGTLRMPDVLPRLSETPGRIRYAGLPMGVHNKEIYQERLGLTEAEMEKLKANGVI
ncbi:MAG: acyl-CoA transferase [Betaproteobacteria bacterium RIFCSPLOWO2_12_FULL_62_13]|nr:MAG: acyl-CoA transferase [Betaproteobacteria bacterium RIFCSPLOWO2_12_FULL_62_13]